MYTDVRGHIITTDNQSAAIACSDAIEKFIQRKIDVVPLLQKSLQADPDCAFTQAVFGLMLHGARNSNLRANTAATLATAQQCHTPTTERERMYVAALESAVAGDLYGLVGCYEKILNEDPTDLLTLVLAQGELFWLGDMKQSLQLSQKVHSSWNREISGYADYLSVRAFDLEEAGQYVLAEACGREGVALDKHNVWGAHAVAHVLFMQGRHAEGVDWLQGLQDHWQDTNQMKFHIWWHQCLFYLEQKQFDAVLDGYDRWVRNLDESLMQAIPDLYIDMQNGASMLWRLEHAGVDVGNRWHEMAELAHPRISDMSSPFTSAHFAIILAAVGQFEDCDALLEYMRKFANTESHSLASRYADAAIPAAVGAVAHRRGDYQAAFTAMMPARHAFWQMGGSHAQQDVFFQILVDAAFKAGHRAEAKALLNEIEVIGFSEPSQRVAYEAVVA